MCSLLRGEKVLPFMQVVVDHPFGCGYNTLRRVFNVRRAYPICRGLMKNLQPTKIGIARSMRCASHLLMKFRFLLAFVLVGSSASARTSLTPDALSFGNQAFGVASAAKTATFKNTQGVAMTITSIVISGGTAPGDYTWSGDCPISPGQLGEGAACSITIIFKPAAVGSRTATLTVAHSAPASPQSVALSGMGVISATLSPVILAFGDQTQGGNRVTRTETPRNIQNQTSEVVDGKLYEADTLTPSELGPIPAVPEQPTLSPGTKRQFIATGYDAATGVPPDLAPVPWRLSNATIDQVNNDMSNPGTVIASAAGTTTIPASTGKVSESVKLTLRPTGFVLTQSLNTARNFHTATLLNNGAVLIAGSMGSTGAGLASAELYSPASGTFTPTGSLNSARAAHTATLLSNGMVLIAGGAGSSNPLASAELYNTATGTFTPTGSLNAARAAHTATLLSNGMVLIAGGTDSSGPLAGAELYNPATGVFTLTGHMNTARYGHTATLLTNGMVLLAGGQNHTASASVSAELYSPATETFTPTGNLNTARDAHTASRLSDGTVLIAGGEDSMALPLASAELYNPTTGTFALTGSLNTARGQHTATFLDGGMVLIAGGSDSNGVSLPSAELY